MLEFEVELSKSRKDFYVDRDAYAVLEPLQCTLGMVRCRNGLTRCSPVISVLSKHGKWNKVCPKLCVK